MAKRVKELCATERDLSVRSLQLEDRCHEALVCEDSAGKRQFADPAFYLPKPLALDDLFGKGRQTFDGAQNVEFDEMVVKKFRYDVLHNGRLGKIYYFPYTGRMTVGWLGENREVVNPSNISGQKLMNRICRISEIDPDLLMTYFRTAAGIQESVFEALGIEW